MGFMRIFHLLNPSGCTMALESLSL